MPEQMPLSTLQALSVFPFADEFPYISDEETLELAQDIEAHGLLNPIVLFENEILDGRNRLRALAKTTLVNVPVVEFDGDHLDALNYVASLNLRRRDLTSGQRAFIAVAYKAQAALAAAQRHGNQYMVGGKATTEQSAQSGKARDEAGAKAGVSGSYVDRAEKLLLNAADLADQVRANAMTLNAAVSELKKRQDASPGAHAGDRAMAADPYDGFEKRVDRAVSSLSDAIADLGTLGRPDDLRYVTEQLQGLIRQAERTFS